MINDSIKKRFTLSSDSWSSDRKTVDTQLEQKIDIGSAPNINSPKYLIVAHQTAARKRASNKVNNVAIFDNLDVRKYHVHTNGIRYPRDDVGIDYSSNDCLDQYRDLKLFYKEYVGKKLLNTFKLY